MKKPSPNDCSTPSKTLSVRLLFLLISLSFSLTTALALRRERLIDAWQPEHYNVSITLNDKLNEIASAQAEIEIKILKRSSLIDLDFGDLITDAVNVNGKPAVFEHRNGKLEIKLAELVNPGTKLTVTVAYHGKPKDGLILTADKDGKPSAVGDNWPDRVHHWIPSFDHPSAKATVTFKITAPVQDIVVANGRLDHVEVQANGNRTWTYTEGVPIPAYCMIIGVGEFVRFEPTGPALTPLSYYVPHSDSPYALKGFAPAAPAVQLFSQTVGPYPYEKLAMIVGATRFGGMENSSAIVFASSLFNPNPNAKLSETFGIPTGTMSVVAHEIAHQWFGDSVTESTWSDLWLSEGFATYFAGLFIQKHDGEEAFQRYMTQAAQTSLAYDKSKHTPIFDTQTENLFSLLNANNYQKGAWVLHMLRSRLGDGPFFRGIRNYYQAHKNATANTEDLRTALEKASGKDLRSFFTRWVYESGHPQYELSSTWDEKRATTTLVLTQLQSGNLFLDPVPITVVTKNGPQDVTIQPTGKTTSKTIKLKAKPTAVEIDPRNTLLKESSVRN